MATARPSLILRASIDEREYSEELAATIKRSYSYIGASTVASHPAAAADAENVLRYDVRLHKPYWSTKDAEAVTQWDDVMPRWLHNMFSKVSSTITASNVMSRKSGTKPLYYAWTELQFGNNVTMAFKTKEDCSLDDSYLAFVEQARNLMGEGALGQDVAVIRIPSRASYEAQKAAIVEERRRQAEEEAAAAAAEEAAVVTEEEVPEEGVETVQEPVAEEPAIADEAEAAVVTEDGEQAEEQPEEAPEPVIEHINFDPDTTIWGIEFADGTIRQYNAQTGVFVD